MNKSILLLAFFVTSVSKEEVDNRQILNLTEPQRNHVSGEMRSLLTGTQNILAALTKDDMAAVTQAAKPLGTGMAHNAENHLHSVLPKDFMLLGMSLHKDFDLIAADAPALKDPKHTLQQLSDARLDEVAQRSSHVMSFALEQTTHVFSKTEQGGVQQVIVKDKANAGQINLIRQHLLKISHEFTQDDFSNPAKIHGDTTDSLRKNQFNRNVKSGFDLATESLRENRGRLYGNLDFDSGELILNSEAVNCSFLLDRNVSQSG